ncbi:MAG: hypothetical protein HC862_10950, partial [Scytonema sp. RU_4_4]|nr:hypothetical protein [Scytonema sp. RU_4_4]
PGYKYGRGYVRPSNNVKQGQDAVQTTKQSGAATDGSTTDQYSNTNNRQNQRAR